VMISTSAFNAVGRPLTAAAISILQMFGLYVPLSLLLSRLMGHAGIFTALAVSYALSAALGTGLFERLLRREERKRAGAVQTSNNSV